MFTVPPNRSVDYGKSFCVPGMNLCTIIKQYASGTLTYVYAITSHVFYSSYQYLVRYTE